MVSWFWKAPHPIAFLFLVPVFITVIITFLLLGLLVPNLPAIYKTYSAYASIGISGIIGAISVRSASQIKDNDADRNAVKYLGGFKRLSYLILLRYFLIAVLGTIAFFTPINQIIYPHGAPLIALLSAFIVIYLVALLFALTPFSFWSPNALTVARINLIAELEPRLERTFFLSDAISSFSRVLARELRMKIAPQIGNHTLLLLPVERRVLSVNLFFAVQSHELENFVRTLAAALGKSSSDIVEPAGIIRDVKRALPILGPLVGGLATVLYYAIRLYSGS